MDRKILEHCPSCGGNLEITEVRCTRCETVVRSRYQPCPFCALTEEQSTFLRLFVSSRGNLSEVEKRLGVSYPTVRAKLDEVSGRLGASEPAAQSQHQHPGHPQQPPSGERRAVLDAIARGELSAAEGLERIRGMRAEGQPR